jgi:hypothetical protein
LPSGVNAAKLEHALKSAPNEAETSKEWLLHFGWYVLYFRKPEW